MDDLIKGLGIDINEDTIAPDEEPDSEYDLSELLEDEDDEKEQQEICQQDKGDAAENKAFPRSCAWSGRTK